MGWELLCLDSTEETYLKKLIDFFVSIYEKSI